MSRLLCLKWNNHLDVMKELKNLLSIGAMVDVTLACDGLSLKAHKIVLSACSPYFRSLFLENPCKHPIVIMKDVKYTDFKAIIDFMYSGEVNIDADQLPTVLKIARTFKVKGLGDVDFENNLMENNCKTNSNNKSENKTGADSSHCVVDTSFSQEQSMNDGSNFRDYEPEIKQEVISVDDIENDDSITEYEPEINLGDISEDMNHPPTLHFEFHGTNSLRSQQQQPLSMPSLETSSKSNSKVHQNCSNYNLASVASPIKLSDVLLLDDEPLETSTNTARKRPKRGVLVRQSMQQQHTSQENRNSNKVKSKVQASGTENSEAKFLVCRACNFKAINSRDYERHMIAIHHIKKQLKCNQCSFVAYFSAYLERHIERDHQKEKQLFKDNVCSNKSAKRAKMKKNSRVQRLAKKKSEA